MSWLTTAVQRTVQELRREEGCDVCLRQGKANIQEAVTLFSCLERLVEILDDNIEARGLGIVCGLSLERSMYSAADMESTDNWPSGQERCQAGKEEEEDWEAVLQGKEWKGCVPMQLRFQRCYNRHPTTTTSILHLFSRVTLRGKFPPPFRSEVAVHVILTHRI